MIEEKPVSVNKMTALAFIPFGWIYVFNRVHKLRIGIGLIFLTIAISWTTQNIIPYPFGFLVSLISIILLEIFVIRKLCKDYNKEIQK